MGRGTAFAASEDEFLVTNSQTKTAKEIFEIHESLRQGKFWPGRSVKSLARRVERLRELDEVGKRTEETRRKAYYERDQRIRGE